MKKRASAGRRSRHRPLWLERLGLLLAGGRWTTQLPTSRRRSLRWLVLDGLLANVSDAIVNAYQSIYLLALGASRAEIGLLSSLSNLALPAAMWPGARLAARSQRYRRLIVISGVVGRLFLLGLILLPYVPARNLLITLGVGFAVARALMLHLLTPAWTAMVGTLVPARWRGRYFSARNIFMGGGALVALVGVGRLIDALGEPLGYQVALGLALLAGVGSGYALSRVKEPARKGRAAHAVRARARAFWKGLGGQRQFLLFCALAMAWNFAVQIASPFFTVFLVDEVGATASLVGLASAASTLAALPAQRIFGTLSDRRGPQWVKRLTGFVIPLVPALWPFISRSWQAFPLQLVSGFAWAGYNLASFNLLLEATPDADRPSFVAFYQAVIGLGMATGAVLGGWLAQTRGYTPVFLLSGVGRLLVALLFAWTLAGSPRPRLPRLPKFPRLPRLPKLRRRRTHKDSKEQDNGEIGDGTASVPREDRSRGHGAGAGRAVRSVGDDGPMDAGGPEAGRRADQEPPSEAG